MRWPLVGREAERDRVLRALCAGGHRGVLLSGTAGVGKTRLAWDCLGRARRRGCTTLRVTATEATAAIPLGAFVPVLEFEPGKDDLTLVQQVIRAVTARASSRRMVLAVDDAHLLDEASAAVVGLLGDAGDVALLLTVRTGEPIPHEVEQQWTSGRLERIDLEPLSRADVERLLEVVLDGPVAATTAAVLWRLCRGNPLLLHEAVQGGLDSGALCHRDGLWQHRGSLASTARLSALVEQRLDRLATAERAALELLAVGEPLGHALLEELVDPACLAALEERGLLVVGDDGRRVSAHAAHPLHREVLRTRMPRSRRRQVCGELAAALEATGLRRREDRLRLADWRLEAGGPVAADVLIEASRHARLAGAGERAVRLAEAALEAGGVDAQVALAEALVAAGRRADAEAAFAAAEARAAGERQRAEAVISRAEHLLYGEHRPEQALAIVRAASAACTDARLRDELAATEAMFHSYTGDFEGALRLADRVLSRAATSDRAVLGMLMIATLSQALLGQPAAALEGIARGERLVPALREELPLAETFLGINRLWALWGLGRLHEAERVGRDGYRRAVDADAVVLVGGWGTWLGALLLERGLAVEAAQRLAEATLAVEQQDPYGIMPCSLALRAHAAALLGDLDGARETLALLDRHYEPGGHRFMLWRGRALTWLAAAEGDLDRACRHAQEAAAWAADNQQRMWRVWALHDLVRLDAPEAAAEALWEVAARFDTPYVSALVAHAQALLEEAPDRLLAVAERFADMGGTVLAAEAAGQAAAAHRRLGAPREARRAAARLRQLARACPGVSTPALAEPPPELTERELEIARLAAQGLTSPQIAEQLVISVRTVDNHLHRAYNKLGVDGRGELDRLV